MRFIIYLIMNSLLYSGNIIIPIFLLILLGSIIKKLGLINQEFIKISSKLVFTLALPSSLFLTISRSDFLSLFNLRYVITVVGGTLLGFIIALISSKIFCKNSKEVGAYLQGAIRGNLAIFGMAVIERALSNDALAIGASLLVFLIPLFNLLAVIALTSGNNSDSRVERVILQGKNIVKNPLIISIFIGAIFSIFKFKLPETLEIPLGYLSKMTLPLALLGIGGTLHLKGLKRRWFPSLGVLMSKLILVPLISIFIALFFDIKGEILGVIFILTGSPVAISSFAMASALNSDTELTADIITITTLFSILTIGIGLAVMKYLGVF